MFAFLLIVANFCGGRVRSGNLNFQLIIESSVINNLKATLPYILKLANDGYKNALKDNNNFLNGLNVFKGKITHKAVAEELGYNFSSPETVIN